MILYSPVVASTLSYWVYFTSGNTLTKTSLTGFLLLLQCRHFPLYSSVHPLHIIRQINRQREEKHVFLKNEKKYASGVVKGI